MIFRDSFLDLLNLVESLETEQTVVRGYLLIVKQLVAYSVITNCAKP